MMEEKAGIENRTIGYKEVLKQKEYMKMIFANLINRFGDSIDVIAFTWLVYALTNSAAWSAIIFGINRVPSIFLQPFAGAMVENMNKKLIMILTDIIRGLCVSLVAILFILDMLNPWMLLGITMAISSAEAFRGPAGMAILPKILDKECYGFGISLNSSLSNVMELVGLASVGAIIAFFGTQTAIFIDAVTFFGSALIIFFINTKEEKQSGKKINFRDYIDTLKGGISYIKKNKIIINFILLALVANGILVPLNSLQAPLVKDLLKQGEFMLSALSLSLTIGMVLGSAIYPYIAKKLNTRFIVFIAGVSLSLFYFLMVLCGYISNYEILVYLICIASSFINGCSLSLLISALNVQLMKQVEAEFLARVGSILSAGCVAAIPVVSFIVSILTKLISLSNIFFIISAAGILYFIVVFVTKVKFDMEVPNN